MEQRQSTQCSDDLFEDLLHFAAKSPAAQLKLLAHGAGEQAGRPAKLTGDVVQAPAQPGQPLQLIQQAQLGPRQPPAGREPSRCYAPRRISCLQAHEKSARLAAALDKAYELCPQKEWFLSLGGTNLGVIARKIDASLGEFAPIELKNCGFGWKKKKLAALGIEQQRARKQTEEQRRQEEAQQAAKQLSQAPGAFFSTFGMK